jgi:hypothetical protein
MSFTVHTSPFHRCSKHEYAPGMDPRIEAPLGPEISARRITPPSQPSPSMTVAHHIPVPHTTAIVPAHLACGAKSARLDMHARHCFLSKKWLVAFLGWALLRYRASSVAFREAACIGVRAARGSRVAGYLVAFLCDASKGQCGVWDEGTRGYCGRYSIEARVMWRLDLGRGGGMEMGGWIGKEGI